MSLHLLTDNGARHRKKTQILLCIKLKVIKGYADGDLCPHIACSTIDVPKSTTEVNVKMSVLFLQTHMIDELLAKQIVFPQEVPLW